MKVVNNILLALLITIFFCAACSKSDDKKGPMEKAGQAVDDALDKAKERTGQVMEKAGEAIKETGEKMRESGQKK